MVRLARHLASGAPNIAFPQPEYVQQLTRLVLIACGDALGRSGRYLRGRQSPRAPLGNPDHHVALILPRLRTGTSRQPRRSSVVSPQIIRHKEDVWHRVRSRMRSDTP